MCLFSATAIRFAIVSLTAVQIARSPHITRSLIAANFFSASFLGSIALPNFTDIREEGSQGSGIEKNFRERCDAIGSKEPDLFSVIFGIEAISQVFRFLRFIDRQLIG